MIRSTWGKRLRQVFAEIDDPDWEAHPEACLLYTSDAADERG